MSARKNTLLLFVIGVVVILLFSATGIAHAAPINDFPITVTQPDGTKLKLFVSGDEYYSWLHDERGYTVIQDPGTGYYVYADLMNGVLVPTGFVVGRTEPAATGLRPNLNISPGKREQLRQGFLDRTKEATGAREIYAPTIGTINNLVIFIRFAGEAEFTDPTSKYANLFNGSTAGVNSLRNYYREVSYNALTINSSLFPTPGTTIVSYQDSHPRGYFQPYNAVTNPIGYSGDQRGEREQTLVKDAINYVNSLGQFPSGASIDGDGDGYVDLISFIVKGEPDSGPLGQSSLLWPHAWVMFAYDVTINGKKVDGYVFEVQSLTYNGILAHETFHVLGAPDLYHYVYNGIFPVSDWDLMAGSGDYPPPHTGCYMKFKYGKWLNSIPELTSPGVYNLNPLTSSTNNCKKIQSPYSTTEYFVLEYRNKTSSIFEDAVPNSGLLVYRINTLANGNAGGPPDEIYIYRPNGTTTEDGEVYNANFGSDVGRAAINDSTNPSSFLSNGAAGGLNLCNIGSSGATMSFSICPSSKYMIRGNAGVGGAVLSYKDGTTKSVTADGNGVYTILVPSGWSGTVTPLKTGYTFTPANRSYSNIQSQQTGQNYTAGAPLSRDTTGVFRPSNGVIFLKNTNASGFADVALNYGLGGDYPVVGDWDGDGVDTIGVYRGNTFLLRNSNTVGFANLNFVFGNVGDQPIAGDWDGDGDDTIGVYRPSTGQFLLKNKNETGPADIIFYLGNVGDIGIAGDWNGDGVDTVGVFRPSNGVIFLKNTNVSGFADVALNYGLAGDKPVVGDWDDNGTTTIGVYRGNKFLLRNSNTNGFANITFDLGNTGDMPIAGDWDGKP